MKHIINILFLIVAFSLQSFSQQNEQYIFPEFTTGKIFFKDYAVGESRLNYNMILGAMQFISPEEGKVLIINDPINTILRIEINGRQFFPFKINEFTEKLTNGDITLHVRKKNNRKSVGESGPYGASLETASSSQVHSLPEPVFIDSASIHKQLSDPKSKSDDPSIKRFYYLRNVKGKFNQISGSKTFEKEYPKHKDAIKEFVKENNIKFNQEDDLKKLIEYCNSL